MKIIPLFCEIDDCFRVCKVFGIRRSFSLVGGVCNPDFGTYLSPSGEIPGV